MAFTVEDGTGLAGANSYIDVTFFREFHTDRGRTVDVGTYADALVQGAAVRASDYVDKRFGKRFRGFRQDSDQGLEWPRIDAFDNDDYLLSGVPANLEKAVAEYTLITLKLGRDLLPLPVPPFAFYDDTGAVTGGASGQLFRQHDVVGPLESDTWYHKTERDPGKNNRAYQSGLVDNFSIPEYPPADFWLEELIESTTSIQLVRA